jgi:hypothetical protein
MLVAFVVAAVWTALGSASAQEPPSTEEIMREDAAELTPYSPSGATATRDTRGSSCVASAPFEFLACGPSTTIQLALMPGIYGTLDSTTTRGGRMAQIVDQLQAMGRAAEPGTMQELARQEDAIDGSSITITIPLIDYGFEGSFSNAAIRMSRANRKEHYSHYQAIGPRDSVPGPGHKFPLSGKVTIEEYSPWVLRGSFSAAMVDLDQSDLTVDDPVLRVIHHLSGSFNVIGPWRGDDRAAVIDPDDLDRTILEDIDSAFGIVGGTQNLGTGATGAASSSGGGSGGGMSCDCSCNVSDSAPMACQSQCAGTFQACQGEPLPMISEAEMDELASLEDRVAAYSEDLRERFEAFIDDGWGDHPQIDMIKESYLEAFDEATSLDARVSMIAIAGMPVDCSPPEEVAERMKMATNNFCNE